VRVLRVGSHLEWWRGGYFEAGSYNDALETCARAIGDQWGEAWALMGHGAVLMFSDPEGAIDLFVRSRRWFGELERDWEAGYAQQLVALGHFYAGRDEAARDAYEEAAVIFERLGHGSVLASVRRGLGLMSARCGQRERGRALCREALAFSESIGDRSGGAQALNFLATISRDEHELETAAELNADALARARQVGDLWATCSALDGIAGVAFERGEPELAARLLARSDVLAERAGYQRPPDDRARRDAQAHALRSALGARELERATAEGELMRVPDAVALARAFVRRLF
jgi:tetratricopeptide (TPR) repeat protein